MTIKLRVAPTLDTPYECPFYREDSNCVSHCFFKLITPLNNAIAIVEDNPNYNPSIIREDCNGEWQKCSYIPLLYTVPETTLDVAPNIEPEFIVANSEVDNYDPFDTVDMAGENTPVRSDAPQLVVPKLTAQKVQLPQDTMKPLDEAQKESIKKHDHKVTLWAVLTPNMYRLKTDVLVYPTNGDLEVEDAKLFDMSHGNIQKECMNYPKPIQMGQIYVTSNGGDHQDGVLASCIYHAVVASPMRVVNDGDVTKCMNISLARSDSRGAKSIAFIPADMGSVDINQMALMQLSTLYKALMTTNFRSLTDIYMVMDDAPSYDAFRLYLCRIFKDCVIEEGDNTGGKYVRAEINN